MTTVASHNQIEHLDSSGTDEVREDAAALTEGLLELLRVVQVRDRDRACCHGLSVSQCYALDAVVRAGSPTVNDLAAALYLDKSTASRVAAGLVERGLVERRRGDADARIVHLEATPQGRAVANAIHAELVEEYATLIADFPASTRAAAAEIVSRLAGLIASRVDASGGSYCVIPTTDHR